MIELAFFVGATAALIYVSRNSLRSPIAHGFYRFFAWECTLVLFLLNVRHWFDNAFSLQQIVSWALLVISLVLVLPAANRLRRGGKASEERRDERLLAFEKTTVLVTDGLYHYIRHPLYSSLLFLDWGIFFKDPSFLGLLLAIVATVFLVATARLEEQEDIRYFGEAYRDYMKRTKMFVPFVI